MELIFSSRAAARSAVASDCAHAPWQEWWWYYSPLIKWLFPALTPR